MHIIWQLPHLFFIARKYTLPRKCPKKREAVFSLLHIYTNCSFQASWKCNIVHYTPLKIIFRRHWGLLFVAGYKNHHESAKRYRKLQNAKRLEQFCTKIISIFFQLSSPSSARCNIHDLKRAFPFQQFLLTISNSTPKEHWAI